MKSYGLFLTWIQGHMKCSSLLTRLFLTIFLRSTPDYKLQIIWSSTLFRQVPYTHMELDFGYLIVFLFQQ